MRHLCLSRDTISATGLWAQPSHSSYLLPLPSPAIACELKGAILATSFETQKFPEKALLPKKKVIIIYANRSLLQGTHLCLPASLPPTQISKSSGWHLQNISLLRSKSTRKVAQLPEWEMQWSVSTWPSIEVVYFW